jgi:DUF971 family protein
MTTPVTNKVEVLLELAQKGDTAVLAELRALLDQRPDLWSGVGDLAALVEQGWIHLLAQRDLFLQEALLRQLAEMRANLAGPSPTPIEKLLVDRIVATWLQLQHSDAAMAELDNKSIRVAEFIVKRQAHANRQYLMAIGALETLRRLQPKSDTITEIGRADRTDASGHEQLLVLAPNADVDHHHARKQPAG